MNIHTHFINTDYSDLAGPYDETSEYEIGMLNRATNQLRLDPSIQWRLDKRGEGIFLQRTNMVFRKSENE